MNETKKRNKNRCDTEILDILVKRAGSQLTTKDIVKEIGLGHSQTGAFLANLRKDIDEKRPYCKNFSYGTIKNPITHKDQFVYRFDESK